LETIDPDLLALPSFFFDYVSPGLGNHDKQELLLSIATGVTASPGSFLRLSTFFFF